MRTDATRDLRRPMFALTMFGCVQFVVLSTIAMVFYPGGTYADANTVGYSFWANFFSDLGRTVTTSGEPNTVSYVLFTVALAFSGLVLIAFFLAAPGLFTRATSPRRLAVAGSVIGVVSGISFIGIAFAPADLYLLPHRLFVNIAFIGFLVVVVCYSVAILRSRHYPNAFALTYIAAALVLAVYVYLLLAGPAIETQLGLTVQAAGQKIVVYAMLVCMFIQAYGARGVLRNTTGPTLSA